MGEGSEEIEVSSGNSFGSCGTHTNNLGYGQKENRGCCPPTLGQVQGSEEEGGCLKAQGLLPERGRPSRLLHAETSPEKLDPATSLLCPPAHREATIIFLKPHPYPVA